MHAYTKAVRLDEAARVRRDFEERFAARGVTEVMSLAQAQHHEPGYVHLIWLSKGISIRALYLDFKPAAIETLPEEAIFLAGYRITFERYFSFEALRA